MNTASEMLAAFAAGLGLARVDSALVEKAKDHLLDTIGVACAGLGHAQVRPIAAAVQRWGGAPEAGVIGTRIRLPAPKAAFLNALHGRIETFDDTHEAGPSHPGSAVVAAALAAAEAAQASGRDFLAALLAGFETATRVSAALGSGHYDAGFHSTGTATPFGAAAAASRARGLNAGQAAGALGLAGEAAIGLRQYQQDGSMLDSALNGARGAELGVAAAEFAASGARGPRGVLDGRWGMLRVMGRGPAAVLTEDLGRRWEFATTSLKPYASCRFTHGPVEVLHAAGLDHHQVESVEIATFRTSVVVADKPEPRDRLEAILSHQVAAALALLGRPVVPRDLESLDEPVRALAKRVRVIHDPALDSAYPARWPHRITVSMKDGRRVALESILPPTAGRAAIQAKFSALAAPVLGAARVDEAAAAVSDLESLSDLRPLLRLLQPEMAEAA